MSQENLDQVTPDVPSVLDMSDDDLLNMDLDTFLASAQANTVEQEEEEEEELDEGGEPQPQAEGLEGGEAKPTEDQDADNDEEEEEEETPPPVQEGDAAAVTPGDEKPVEKTDAAAPVVDYEAEYNRLMAPFKANGKEMQVESIDDAISLMQMGANYNKKMAALKPNLKLLKLLENNGLLNEEKISFLIDLEKKNPQAIGKLIQDSGLDPLDMDVSKENGYKPSTYTVDDRELELDRVLEEIQDTPGYVKTIDVVTTKFDGKSKQIVADNPQLLKVINDHIESGIYDRISTEVERERMLGRLNGLSDLEAYRQVGDALNAKGAFAQLVPQRQEQAPARVAAPAPKAEDPRIKDKKRAASPTKAAPVPVAKPADFNPLALSDEDFSKLVKPKLL